jgi:hypothetical protein
MKDLTGYLKKILYLFSISFFFSILFSNISSQSLASEDFSINTNFNHLLTSESVETEVILQVNSTGPRVISYYTASIPLSNLRTTCKNYKTGEPLECSYYHRGSVTDVLIHLNNSITRPENPLEIAITYSTPINEANSYNVFSEVLDTKTAGVTITYPKEMGEPFWSSDPIQSIRLKGQDYLEIYIGSPTQQSVSLLFGESVTYRFDIKKVFSNTINDENQTFELYVPSDTYSQLIIWDDISPLPNTALQDEDGNYIFKYVVGPNETIDCTVSGYIQMLNVDQEQSADFLFLTEKTGYWTISNNTEFTRVNTYLRRRGLEVDNSFDNIENLQDSERELFYRYVYQYVIDRLDFSKDINLGITNETRLGANTLTENPNNSSAIDYADFYIALLRKYNIPGRLVVGYVSNITGYTSDGFYHHWVEYYDTQQEKWIVADPFLEDYFEKPLFGNPFYDHIVIIRRGKSAVAPKLSFFTETDFLVRSETELEITGTFNFNSDLSFEELISTKRYLRGYLYISNTGNTTINNFEIVKSNLSEINTYVDPINNLRSRIILPKQNATVQFNVPTEDIVDDNIDLNITLSNLGIFNEEISLSTPLEKDTPIYISIISKIISVLLFSVLVFLVYLGINFIRKRKNG